MIKSYILRYRREPGTFTLEFHTTVKIDYVGERKEKIAPSAITAICGNVLCNRVINYNDEKCPGCGGLNPIPKGKTNNVM